MIYLVEDDESIRELVIYTLQTTGLTAKGFSCAKDFWNAMKQEYPSMVLLDIMLPDEDGLTILKKLRDNGPTRRLPVIMLTAKGTEYDKVVGLDGGADDYIPKPFLVRELVIKVNKLLKAAPRHAETLELPPYKMELDKHTVLENGQPISLTVKEYDLLAYFAANPDSVLSRTDILNKVWGYDYFGTDRVVDDTIRRLRRKLPKLLLDTVYGLGYRLNKEGL